MRAADSQLAADALARPESGRSRWRATVGLIWRISPAQTAGVLLATIGAGLVPVASVAFTTRAVQAVADGITAGDTPSTVTLTAAQAVAGLIAVAVAGHLLGTFRRYIETLLQYRMANAVQELIMRKALGLGLADFENAEVYDTIQRANKEAAYRPFQIFTTLVSVATGLVTLISLAVVLLDWNVAVGLAVMLAPLPTMLANMVFSRIFWRLEYGRSPDRRRLTYLQYLVTTDRTFKETRLFGLGPLFVTRFTDTVRGFYEVDRALERRQGIATALLGLISVAAAGGAMLFAASDSLSSGQIGQFAGYLAAIGVAQSAAQMLVGDLTQLYEHNLFLGNLFAFLTMPASAVTSGSRPFPTVLRSGVEFRDVTFRYPGTDVDVLDRLSLHIPAGSCVALVGHNGSGKTTLIKLLARFYAPDEGTILIDGVPIEEYDLDSLRHNIGVIFQDFVQYEASARENIGYSDPGRLEDGDALSAAASRSGASEFLAALPSGFATQLGRWFDDGHQLSGGQWQRIALARAFFRDAALTVLDEPTASIDAAAEADIFTRLRAVAGESTTLLIAHRFSTVRVADMIAVLDDGRVVEQGSHADLMALDGRYATLFRLQAAGYLDDRAGADA